LELESQKRVCGVSWNQYYINKMAEIKKEIKTIKELIKELFYKTGNRVNVKNFDDCYELEEELHIDKELKEKLFDNAEDFD